MKLHLIALSLAFAPVSASVAGELWHVEPANWWVGMREPRLQILIHGDNIAETTPRIECDGLLLEQVVHVDNPNYLFLYVQVDKSAKSGSFDIVFEKDGKIEARYAYELRARREGSAQRQGFDNADVIYEIVPDRFANGDPSNDSVPGMLEMEVNRAEPYGRHGGDIRGIINALPYLEDMGFGALWLTPVTENDMSNQSYHGYAITDFYKIDPRIGDMDDYVELSRKGAEHGIKIVMDMIFNHCGSEHWWMKDLPTADWINEYPDYRVTHHRRTVNQDPHASAEDTDLMRRGWFVPTMPDMNVMNPLFADYLIQNSIWWVEAADLGGIRVDTYPYPDKRFMSRWCARILEEYPNLNIVGEEWTFNPAIVSYWQRGKLNKDGYEGNLPSLFDFPMRGALVDSLNGKGHQDGESLTNLYEMLANDFLYADSDNMTVFLGNHDIPRYYMELGKDTAKARNAMVWLMTMRGIPQFYYGDEILMTHDESMEHGHIRKDFPGGWAGDDTDAISGKGLSDEALQFKAFVRNLLNWRKSSLCVQEGRLVHFAPRDDVYVYFRTYGEDCVMVVINNSEKAVALDMGEFASVAGPYTKGHDILGGKDYDLGEGLDLSPMTPCVIELR
ncbi:MAG: glycoside hydrolase family 13 protein [Opitutales bacterium]|nr:glycoside hydrolase family 13 protein [Opitutales bacterium]